MGMELKLTPMALLFMIICMLLGFTIAMGSLISMGGELRTEALPPLSIPTILVSILDPLAIVLEFVAVIMIFVEARKMGGVHRKLTSLSLCFLIAWLVLNFGVFTPISLMGLTSGSLSLVRIALAVKSSAAILQYIIPLTLIYGLASVREKKLLLPAAALTTTGNFLLILLPIWSVRLTLTRLAGMMLIYRPVIEVNYLSQPYLTLLLMGYIGGILYMTAYVSAYFRLRRSLISHQKGRPTWNV